MEEELTKEDLERLNNPFTKSDLEYIKETQPKSIHWINETPKKEKF
jgi:hypothetical protein